MKMMIPLWKILRERIEVKILRQQIFSLTSKKGGWLKTIRLFNSPDQAYFYKQATRLQQHIVTVFDITVGYRNVLSISKFTPVNDKNEFGLYYYFIWALWLGKDEVKRVAEHRRN